MGNARQLVIIRPCFPNPQISSMMKKACLFLLVLLTGIAAAEVPSVEDFAKFPEFRDISLSPDGQHFAAAVPRGDRTDLAIVDISDPGKPQLKHILNMPQFEEAAGVIWINNERVAVTTTQGVKRDNAPRLTGNMYASNIDGSRKEQLAGASENRSMILVNSIPYRNAEEGEIMVVAPILTRRRTGNLKVVSIDSYSGDVTLLDRGPDYANRFTAGLAVDRDGEARLAASANIDQFDDIEYYFKDKGSDDWRSWDYPFAGIPDFLGFDKRDDNRYAWIASEDKDNFGLYRLDTKTMEMQQVLTDPVSEVQSVIWDRRGENVIGARFMPGEIVTKFIDPTHPDTKLWRGMQQAFPDQVVSLGRMHDGSNLTTVFTYSDRNPGVTYLYNAENNEVRFLSATMPWIKPDQLGETRPVMITARDGVELPSYLTLPPVKNPENLPLVVYVHGGPHGPYDTWGYEATKQMLATRGYAVLQVNFRGSGGYGYQFETSGYQKWGAEMQDDLTDATRWAVEQGYADPNRICIYGASYGGYATLAGVTKEPELYQCGLGYVGVYDLELIRNVGDIQRNRNGESYLDAAVGTDPADLKKRSPVNHVDKIKADLFLVHGKEDIRAHVEHYYQLKAALNKAGIPYDDMLLEKEAHGFYDEDNRADFYKRMLAFFDRNIGDSAADDRQQVASGSRR